MIMFTSFNSLQNIVSKLYDEYGYQNLGQTALMFIYGAFGVGVFFSSFIVKKLGYKKAMFFSSLGYGVFEATGFLIVTNVDLPHALVWVIICLGACVCGVSASTLWVAQGAYTSNVADKDSKAELFGVFWALMMSSQIIGNLLITFVLGKLSNFIYFMLLTILGCNYFLIRSLKLCTVSVPTQCLQRRLGLKIIRTLIQTRSWKSMGHCLRQKISVP